MSTHNICFYEEIRKIFISITPLIWSCKLLPWAIYRSALVMVMVSYSCNSICFVNYIYISANNTLKYFFLFSLRK